jgi:hypothetical protein
LLIARRGEKRKSSPTGQQGGDVLCRDGSWKHSPGWDLARENVLAGKPSVLSLLCIHAWPPALLQQDFTGKADRVAHIKLSSFAFAVTNPILEYA